MYIDRNTDMQKTYRLIRTMSLVFKNWVQGTPLALKLRDPRNTEKLLRNNYWSCSVDT